MPLVAGFVPLKGKRPLSPDSFPPTFTPRVPTLLETPRHLPLQTPIAETTTSEIPLPTGLVPTPAPSLPSPDGIQPQRQSGEIPGALNLVQGPAEPTAFVGSAALPPSLQVEEAPFPGATVRAFHASTPEKMIGAPKQDEALARPVPAPVEIAPVEVAPVVRGPVSMTPSSGDTPARPGQGNQKSASPGRVQGKANPVLSGPATKVDPAVQPLPKPQVEPTPENRSPIPSREGHGPAALSGEVPSAPTLTSPQPPWAGNSSPAFTLPLQPANPANASVPLTPAAPAHPVAIQVGDSLKWILRQANPSAELQLHPENLGKVTIQLKVNGTEVHARVWASEASTLPVLQDHRAYLEVSLRQQGLQLGSFDLQQGQRGHQPQPQMPSTPFSGASQEAKVGLTRQETPIAMASSFASSHRIEVMA